MAHMHGNAGWNAVLDDESLLRLKQQMKKFKSNGHPLKKKDKGKDIPEPSCAIQTWPREGKQPIMETTQEYIFHDNENADTSARQLNKIHKIGFLSSEHFQESQKMAMKTYYNFQGTSTPREHHEVFKLVKQLKRVGPKLLSPTSSINSIDNLLFVDFVNLKLKYSKETRHFWAKYTSEILQEIADEQISKVGLTPSLLEITSSWNFAEESNVVTVSRSDGNIPGYIESLSKTVIGFALIYIAICKD
jgi:hypothetical protein